MPRPLDEQTHAGGSRFGAPSAAREGRASSHPASATGRPRLAAAPQEASRRPRARRAARRVVATLAVSVAAAATLIVAGRSPLLGLTRVEVTGLHVLHRTAVLRAADVHTGEPVLDVQPGVVAARVSRLPWVAHVSVTRLYPAGLRIQVQERRAVAWLPTTGSGVGKGWLLAPDGTVLAPVRASPSLPVLGTSPTVSSLAAGSKLSSAPVRAALTVLGVTSAAWSRTVTVVQPASARGLEFRLRAGTTVVYGSAALATQKQAAVTAMLHAARAQGRLAAVIDVRAPSAPTLRMGP